VWDEGRKRVLAIVAGILAARKLAQYDGGKRVPATMSAISDAVRWAEEIMREIDQRWPAGGWGTRSDLSLTLTKNCRLPFGLSELWFAELFTTCAIGGENMANKKTRKVRAAARPKTKAQKNPKAGTTRTQPMPKSVVSQNRSEGLRLFKLAGRPTKEQFILVYGERGPKMTWDQRAAAGVPASKFQAVLAQKGGSRPSKAAAKKKAARPARNTKKSVRTPEATANVLDRIPATLNTGN
jgi:hypothetical protein